MKKLIIVSVVSLAVGFGLAWQLHKPKDVIYSNLDLKQAISSGGLSVPCKIPYSLEYCISHPEAQ